MKFRYFYIANFEQVALKIDWDVYGLINNINNSFTENKLWLDVAVHMQGKYRENVQSEFIQNNTTFDGFIEPIITLMFIA